MKIDNQEIKKLIKDYANNLIGFELPSWETIPNFGLYMEQVLILVSDYLCINKDSVDSELTASTINNYVRMKIIPQPVKKKYYRTHIAYIIIVCALKKSLSIQSIGMLLSNFNEDNIEKNYNSFKDTYLNSTKYIYSRIKDGYISPTYDNDDFKTLEMIIEASIIGGLTIDVSELVVNEIKKENIVVTEKDKKEKKK